MKFSIKHISLRLLLLLVVAGIGPSCEKDEPAANNGEPVVYYVRSTEPAKADSLLAGAFMGNLIAIVGDNLGDTREMWFNDQRATLNPTYITNKTILVNVPSTVPAEVTNQIRFVFGDGSEYRYDFSVNVPGPVLTGIKCEYVPDGQTAVLYGDFFFEPKVFFPGDKEAEVVNFDKTFVEVTVPDGSVPGQIELRTKFGKARSSFYFRDDRNTILDFDNLLHETWTAPIANAAENPDPAPCSGNYAYFKNDADGAWMWVNELTMQYWAPRGRGNRPLATGSINDLVFRFEANVPIEWKDVRMEIFLGPYAEDHGRDVSSTAVARWQPWKNGPFTTDGWQTISIPLTEFKYYKDDPADAATGTRMIENLSSLTNVTMMLFGPADGANPVYIAFDNVRIVEK